MKIYAIVFGLLMFLIIIIVVYFIVKKMKGGKGEKEELNSIDADEKLLKKQGIKTTLAPSKVSAIANSISSALSKAGYTKSDAFSEVYRAILQLKNDADLLAVKKAYGIREIYNGLGNIKSSPKLTLSESIYLFSPKEVNLINTALAKQNVARF